MGIQIKFAGVTTKSKFAGVTTKSKNLRNQKVLNNNKTYKNSFKKEKILDDNMNLEGTEATFSWSNQMYKLSRKGQYSNKVT